MKKTTRISAWILAAVLGICCHTAQAGGSGARDLAILKSSLAELRSHLEKSHPGYKMFLADASSLSKELGAATQTPLVGDFAEKDFYMRKGVWTFRPMKVPAVYCKLKLKNSAASSASVMATYGAGSLDGATFTYFLKKKGDVWIVVSRRVDGMS
jgi:hypothetical protein